MRGTFDFDPDACNYGPATAAVRTILKEWIDIDWFVPTTSRDDDGALLYREHNRRAYARDTELFVEHVGIGFDAGGLAEYETWCARVRDYEKAGTDWKFSILKPMSRAHMDACDFDYDRDTRQFTRPLPPQPGDLFVDVGASGVFWNIMAPSLDVAESQQFYVGYAHGDMHDAILWQLAERSNDLRGNPFWPLLRLYHAGFYPFYLARDHVVLFRFAS